MAKYTTAESIFEGTASGAGTGALIGSFFTPVGTAIGAGIGGLLGLIGGAIVGGKKKREEDIQEELSNVTAYERARAEQEKLDTDIKLQQAKTTVAERKLSEYDNFLSTFQDKLALKETEFKQSTQSQFSKLLENYSGSEVLSSARGQVGGSSAIIANIARQSVVDYAGTDLTLNAIREGSKGGVYGKQLQLFEREMADSKTSSLIAKQDLTTSLENYRSSISSLKETSARQGSLANIYKKKVNKQKTSEDLRIDDSGRVYNV